MKCQELPKLLKLRVFPPCFPHFLKCALGYLPRCCSVILRIVAVPSYHDFPARLQHLACDDQIGQPLTLLAHRPDRFFLEGKIRNMSLILPEGALQPLAADAKKAAAPGRTAALRSAQ